MTTEHPKPAALVIVGPTGVGKTRLSLAIAERMEVEVISADSRQVYRYMDIGTSKPSREERSRVVHHLIDVVDPDQEYSAGTYGQQAREAVRDVAKRSKTPLIVGGSGLYIRALLHGFFEPHVSDPEVRQTLKQRAASEGSRTLFEELRRVDPLVAQRVHPNDAQRIVRALEVFQITGRRLSEWQRSRSQPLELEPLVVGLSLPREQLYQLIDRRVDRMIADGFVGEVEDLRAWGYGPHLNALQTVGYQEIFGYLSGRYALDEAVQTIKRNTRRYAKRQLTWFSRHPNIRWLGGYHEGGQDMAGRCIELFQGQGQTRKGGGKFSVDRTP